MHRCLWHQTEQRVQCLSEVGYRRWLALQADRRCRRIASGRHSFSLMMTAFSSITAPSTVIEHRYCSTWCAAAIRQSMAELLEMFGSWMPQRRAPAKQSRECPIHGIELKVISDKCRWRTPYQSNALILWMHHNGLGAASRKE